MTGTVAAVGEEWKSSASASAWPLARCRPRPPGLLRRIRLSQHRPPAAGADSVDDRGIASLELAMCVAVSLLPLKKLDAIAGKRAAVNGLGPAGLIAGQMLRAEGATSVIGFEPNARRRDLAVGLAVDEAFDPRDPATAERVPPRAGGAAVDVAIDCVGYPDATRYLMDHTGRHVALFAVQRHDYTYALGRRPYRDRLRGALQGRGRVRPGPHRPGKISLRPLIWWSSPRTDAPRARPVAPPGSDQDRLPAVGTARTAWSPNPGNRPRAIRPIGVEAPPTPMGRIAGDPPAPMEAHPPTLNRPSIRLCQHLKRPRELLALLLLEHGKPDAHERGVRVRQEQSRTVPGRGSRLYSG